MMNKKLSIALVISSGLLFSCQPKDVALNTNRNTSNNTNVTNLSTNDSDKLLVLSVDRQVETLHLLKAALNPAYAEAHGLVNDGKTLSSKNGRQTIDSDKYASEYVVNFEIQKVESNGKLQLLVLKNKSAASLESKGFIKDGSKKTDFVSKAMSEYIAVKATENANEYIVSMDRVDETNSKADRQTVVDLNIESLLQWDGSVEALDSEISLQLTSLAIDRKMNKVGSLSFEKIESALKLKLAECTSLNGTINLTQKIMTKDAAGKMTIPKFISSSLVVTDSSIEISERGFKSAAQACELRPVVDLTKML